jgi:hypothetical protein
MKRLALATLLLFTSVAAMPAIACAQVSPKPSALSIPITGAGSGRDLRRHVPASEIRHRTGPACRQRHSHRRRDDGRGRDHQRRPHDLAPSGRRHDDVRDPPPRPRAADWDLLGLQIDLSRVVLDITAQAGAGNLLGNLLCAVANLLNDPSGLSRLLNSILDLLR